MYSSALEWAPQGDQESDFADAPCKPASDNILLAKLRPGQVRTPLILSGLVTKYFILQEISMALHAIKSNGMDHAKWSPVGVFPVPTPLQKRNLIDVYLIATASYRLMPHIQIAPEGIPTRLCDKFAQCFAPGVIEVKANRSTGDISLCAGILIHLHFWDGREEGSCRKESQKRYGIPGGTSASRV